MFQHNNNINNFSDQETKHTKHVLMPKKNCTYRKKILIIFKKY